MELLDFWNVILDFLKLFPDVALEAFGIFIIIAALKAVDWIPNGTWARISGGVLAYLFNGAQLPKSDYAAQKVLATVFFAALFWELAEKVVAPYAQKAFAYIAEKLPKKAPAA